MNPVPRSIKELVQKEQIGYSDKAYDSLLEGLFSLDDLIYSIINGAVVKKERDETRKARYKYTIIGPALGDRLIYSCGKIIEHKGRKQYFIITFHEERPNYEA